MTRAGIVSLCVLAFVARAADDLAVAFESPPPDARPWVYWFWINGNITREGLTADLEAMKRAGIGGALIMEVGETKHEQSRMAPAGLVAFGSPAWRGLFHHALAEAGRLGLRICMNNDAGWCGSGGPWNEPEFSMQRLVWTDTPVEGPRRFEDALPLPKAKHGFYRDIAVLAFPASVASAPASPPPKKAGRRNAPPASRAPAPAPPVPKAAIVNLSGKTNSAGRMAWDAPEGRWIVRRIGHASTGRANHPAPAAGLGLECDKFSAEAVRRHFEGFIGKLAAEAGPAAGKAFAMTHVDSWEVGEQDWTPLMSDEFRARRGYDLLPWLVALTGGPDLDSAEVTGRFRRDFRKTQSELVVERYAGTLRSLAAERGLRLSVEAYGPDGGFLNPLDYGAAADLPMAEFWVKRWDAWHSESPRLLASAAHTTGRPVAGAEAFTALGQNDSWTEHPYSIKALGDWVFCEGVNRFVLHRMVHQPWLTHEPGMSFGPFGTHFDRNQTWWEPGAAFMGYLARCQFLLQRGGFVADVCRLVPDGENHGARGTMASLPGRFTALPPGYNHDYVSAAVLQAGATVVDGRIALPSGMSYRVLQLPESDEMDPGLLRAIHDLVRAGAVVAGPPPRRAPGLCDHPRCDDEVRAIADELWAGCDGTNVTEHAFGAGRVVRGRPMADLLRETVGAPDLAFVVDPLPTAASLASITARRRGKGGEGDAAGTMPTAGLNWIHRRDGDADLYFVANPQHRPVDALCTFRVAGKRPELWNPETGTRALAAAFVADGGGTRVPIHFTPAGSVFVVFRAPVDPAAQVVAVRRDGVALFDAATPTPAALPVLECGGGGVRMRAGTAGSYELTFADARTRTVDVPAVPAPAVVSGPWRVGFQSGRGALESAVFETLTDWTAHGDEGIRHFSGTAEYRTRLEVASGQWRVTTTNGVAAPSFDTRSLATCHMPLLLDLGRVEVIAEVSLNGRDLGVLWKPPFEVDITDAVRPGSNELVVRVTNLWPNRLIGDEWHPDDCTPDGHWTNGGIEAWPEWILRGAPRPEPRRLAFTTWKYYSKDAPLLPSGLLGPVTIREHPSYGEGR